MYFSANFQIHVYSNFLSRSLRGILYTHTLPTHHPSLEGYFYSKHFSSHYIIFFHHNSVILLSLFSCVLLTSTSNLCKPTTSWSQQKRLNFNISSLSCHK